MAQWGKEDKVADAPTYVTNATTGETGTTEYGTGKVLGISTTEAAILDGAASPGWVRIVEGTGGRTGRKQIETLVAMRNMVDIEPEVP